MAQKPQAVTAPPPSNANSAALALQKAFEQGADENTLVKMAGDLGVVFDDPASVATIVAYRDKGGKGASIIPGLLPQEPAVAAIPKAETPAPGGIAALDKLAEYYKNEPIGLDPETLRKFGAMPGEFAGPGGVLGAINYAALAPVNLGRAGLELLGEALPQAVATGIGQGLENINIGGQTALQRLGNLLNPNVVATPQSFARDVTDFANMATLYAGAQPGAIPSIRRPTAVPEMAAPEIAAPRIAEVAAPTTPLPFPTVSRPRATAAEIPVIPEVPVAAELPTMKPGEGPAALAGMAEKGQTQPIPKLDISKNVADFAAEYLNAGNLTRPADMPFSEFFYRHVKAGTVPEEQFRSLVDKYNLTDQDVMELFTGTRQGLGDAARTMQRFSIASRYVPAEAGELAKLGTEQASDLGLWKRFTNVYRGALVSNMATTMRNNISSLARVPIDIATNLADSAINAVANPFRETKVGVNPMDAFAVITDRFKPEQNKKFYEQLRNAQPGVNKELAATYASDVARVTKKDAFAKAEKAVDTLNLFNRVSETATRKAMFPVFLRREATKLGADFDALVNSDALGQLPESAFQNALNDTLDFTYAKRPERDSFSDLFVRTVEKGGLPLATVMPFPRFMTNAMKFQFDYSPAGFAKLLSKTERERFAAGDTSALSKAMIGSTLLYSAYQFRNSDNAGEKWYEAKTPSGKTFDLRPFFPAAPYLLVADVIKRAQDGTVDQAFEAKDILQGLTGAQFRAGGGLYVADELLKDLSSAGTNAEKAKTVVTSWLANLGSGFLAPFQQFKDFYAQYNPEEAVYRDAKDSVAGTLLRTVPGAQKALGVPEAELATREGPSTTVDPALRQLLGVTIKQEKNFVESELDRLGLSAYDVGPKTGDPEMDRLINRDLGVIAERAIVPMLQDSGYKQLDDVRKTQALKSVFAKAREAAVAKFSVENPELALLKSLKGRSREEKILINQAFQQRTGQDAEGFLRQLREAPLVRTQGELDKLPKGTKYTDPGDYKVYEKK